MRRERRVVVDVEVAGPVRRQVGPTAWVVIEALAADAEGDGGSAMAAASCRSLAAEVGVSKDAVARALHRLVAAGVVKRAHHREAGSGRFGVSGYRVDLAAAGLALTPGSAVAPGGPSVEPGEVGSDADLGSSAPKAGCLVPPAPAMPDTGGRGRRRRPAPVSSSDQLTLLG